MKTILLFVALVFALPAVAQDETPLADLIGIPVMEGLTEAQDARLVFDKPEGRIIHAELVGDSKPNQVAAFYKETLYQLGWVLEREWIVAEANGLIFIREEEQLVLIIREADPLEVILDLGPAKDAS